MKILMMGPQGSGKGTIGEMLGKELNLPLIPVGQLLRDIKPDNPRYEEVHKVMEAGILVPQDFVAELLKERVTEADCVNGYIMDGWGRKDIDLKYFDPSYDLVLFLKISPETSVERIGSRRTCSKCAKVYNVVYLPPRVEGICDVCGGELIQRPDDTEEAVLKRLAIFYSDTQSVLDSFREKGILREIDAEVRPDEVYKDALAVVKEY